MNTSKRILRSDTERDLSAIERSVPFGARRHRAGCPGPWQRLRSFVTRGSRRSLMITASVAGLLVTASGNAPAAVSAPAFFNEANAAQREGRLGAAILGYERARLLASHDSAIEQNLRIAREKAGVNAPALSVWERPAHYLGFDALALLGSSALVISCALFFGRPYVPSWSHRPATWIAVGCGAVILLTASSMALRWSELDRAVIQNAQTTAHIAPAANAQSAFDLRAGDLVTTKREHGDFFLVRTLDQRSGWVKKADVERVIPPNPSPM